MITTIVGSIIVILFALCLAGLLIVLPVILLFLFGSAILAPILQAILGGK